MRTYPIRLSRIWRAMIPNAVYTLDEGHKGLYELTFDDGPHPESTPQLLLLLAHQKIRARFFLSGKQAHAFPQLVDDIRDQGHLIGNHGYEHLDGWLTPNKDYIKNVERGRDLLSTMVFRPPYGRISRSQLRSLQPRQLLYMWSLMPGDFDAHVNSMILYDRLLKHTRSRDIIVLHDTPRAVAMLDSILGHVVGSLRERGLYPLYHHHTDYLNR